jgi:ParB/RepB/Spo0J family partition protein
MSSQTLQQMSVDDIVPSKDNSRHIDQKSQSFQELVNSIRAGGVRIPIHVWPHPKRKGKYEIRAGERRWRACKSLGHKTIPAIVHRGVDIQYAMTLTMTENKFREKLTPLEEVEEIARCMDYLKSDAKLIAGLVGQTEQWVRLRANIHKNLEQGWRQAFLNLKQNHLFKDWTIGHLTLIARLPATSQKELLAEIKRLHWQWKNVSVQDLERRIGGSLMLLTKAKWNLDNETLLPKAGACSKCKKRTGAEPVLWYGTADDQIKSKDRCLDPQCWNNKMKIYLQQRAKQLSEEHSNLAYITTDYLSSNEKEELTKNFGRVLDQHDIQKSTKSAKGSIPALVVSGDGMGKVIYVKEKQFARPGGAKRPGRVTPLKERRAFLKNKRWAQVLIVLREKVEAAGVDKVVYKDKITSVMALVAVYGNESAWGSNITTCQKEIKRLIEHRSKNATANYPEALISLWNSFKPTLDRILTYGGPVTQTSQFVIDNAKWIAELIQVDINELFKEVSKQKGFTEPKSWKHLNEDGTPKVEKKSGKKKSAKSAA